MIGWFLKLNRGNKIGFISIFITICIAIIQFLVPDITSSELLRKRDVNDRVSTQTTMGNESSNYNNINGNITINE